MIIKQREGNHNNIEQLKTLLKLPHLSNEQQHKIKQELWNQRVGEKGEKNSAHYIDFYYGHNKHWAIIHDLRLEWNGKVAQIDHLLINKFFEFYVLESKNFFNGISINANGEFSAFYDSGTYGIASPIEQNAMHIHFLKNYFKYNKILPKRLGFEIKPIYHNYVLISPDSIIKRPSKKAFNTDSVIKADALKKTIDKLLDDLTPKLSDLRDMTKIVKISTMNDFAIELACNHKPAEIDYEKKFGITPKAKPLENKESDKPPPTQFKKSRYYCYLCNKNISKAEAMYCWRPENKAKFGNKAYCRNCQSQL